MKKYTIHTIYFIMIVFISFSCKEITKELEFNTYISDTEFFHNIYLSSINSDLYCKSSAIEDIITIYDSYNETVTIDNQVLDSWYISEKCKLYVNFYSEQNLLGRYKFTFYLDTKEYQKVTILFTDDSNFE